MGEYIALMVAGLGVYFIFTGCRKKTGEPEEKTPKLEEKDDFRVL